MLTRGHLPGDTIIRTGRTLVIATITGENAGTLVENCPADAAGTGVPVRIRFQPDGSRVAAQTRNLIDTLGAGTLQALAALDGTGGDKGIYFTGPNLLGSYNLTAFARSLLDDADQTTALATLGAQPAGNYQPLDSDLTAIAALATQPFGRSLLTMANDGAARNTLNAMGVVKVQVFSTSGTYTPSANMKYCIVEVVGGGGGGGSVAASGGSQLTSAAGGSAGGYALRVLSAAAVGSSQAVTVGAGGAGASAGPNNGGAGGNSSFGSLCVATGGGAGGGAGAGGTGGLVATGGTGTVGDFGVVGGSGQVGPVSSGGSGGLTITGGMGGASIYGGGGYGQVNGSNGGAGAARGSGGGGSASSSGGPGGAGGAGAAGLVVITEFCSS